MRTRNGVKGGQAGLKLPRCGNPLVTPCPSSLGQTEGFYSHHIQPFGHSVPGLWPSGSMWDWAPSTVHAFPSEVFIHTLPQSFPAILISPSTSPRSWYLTRGVHPYSDPSWPFNWFSHLILQLNQKGILGPGLDSCCTSPKSVLSTSSSASYHRYH